MARIAVIGEPFEKALLQDLEKRQTLREHTIHPPGQERYIRPIDKDALRALLAELAGGAVTMAEVEDFLAATVGANNISLANIETAAEAQIAEMGAGDIDEEEDQKEIQDLISYRILETGHFLLSFHGGILRGMLDVEDEDGDPAPWIKVLADDGNGLFEL